jgi:uncharacterized membrane protein YciS (DUF1049 family)
MPILQGIQEMKQVLAWVIGLPVAFVLIGFSLANRQIITVSFDPISSPAPMFALSVPIWMLFFAGILLGIVIGGFVSWLNQGKWRKAARQARADLDIELARKKDLERRLNQGDLVSTGP